MRQSAIYAGCAASTAVLLRLLYGHFTAPLPNAHAFEHIHVPLADPEAALDRFAGLLRFRTVSSHGAPNHVVDAGEFRKQAKYLRSQWPVAFKRLSVRQVSEHSLLLGWQGADAGLKPVLCISHQDVVAVDSDDKWTHPPFSGARAGGYVWGRGALDVKVTVAALLEAVTHLVERGFAPQRTLYLAFGHDEEVGGAYGAGAMAALLKAEGVELEYIADEGGAVLLDGLGTLVTKPLALVGTAEKAYSNFAIEVHAKGGHSMVPPKQGRSAVTRLASILKRLDQQPPPPRLVPPTSHLLQAIGEADGSSLTGLLLRNCDVWPLSALLARVLSYVPGEISSCVRTTAVATELEVFPPGNNVVPSLARAFVNFRTLPDDEPGFAERYLNALVEPERRHGRVDVTAKDSLPLSPLADRGSAGFAHVRRAALETLGGPQGLIVAPYLMLGRTDSSHYVHTLGVRDVLRFIPFTVNATAGELRAIHGIDERVAEASYLRGVQYFVRFLELSLS